MHADILRSIVQFSLLRSFPHPDDIWLLVAEIALLCLQSKCVMFINNFWMSVIGLHLLGHLLWKYWQGASFLRFQYFLKLIQ